MSRCQGEACWTRSSIGDRNATRVLDRIRVRPGRGRKFGPHPHVTGTTCPSGKEFIDRAQMANGPGVARYVVNRLAALIVRGRDFHFIEPLESVNLGQRNASAAVDLGSLPSGNCV